MIPGSVAKLVGKNGLKLDPGLKMIRIRNFDSKDIVLVLHYIETLGTGCLHKCYNVASLLLYLRGNNCLFETLLWSEDCMNLFV